MKDRAKDAKDVGFNNMELSLPTMVIVTVSFLMVLQV